MVPVLVDDDSARKRSALPGRALCIRYPLTPCISWDALLVLDPSKEWHVDFWRLHGSTHDVLPELYVHRFSVRSFVSSVLLWDPKLHSPKLGKAKAADAHLDATPPLLGDATPAASVSPDVPLEALPLEDVVDEVAPEHRTALDGFVHAALDPAAPVFDEDFDEPDDLEPDEGGPKGLATLGPAAAPPGPGVAEKQPKARAKPKADPGPASPGPAPPAAKAGAVAAAAARGWALHAGLSLQRYQKIAVFDRLSGVVAGHIQLWTGGQSLVFICRHCNLHVNRKYIPAAGHRPELSGQGRPMGLLLAFSQTVCPRDTPKRHRELALPLCDFASRCAARDWGMDDRRLDDAFALERPPWDHEFPSTEPRDQP